MVNFGPLTAELPTPANFNGFGVMAVLLHGTVAVGVSQTLRVEQRAPRIYSAGWPSCWELAHTLVCFYCLFFCTVTDLSAVEKDRGVKFCMHVSYYLDRSSPLLVNFGLQGVMGAALVCVTSGMNAPGP